MALVLFMFIVLHIAAAIKERLTGEKTLWRAFGLAVATARSRSAETEF